MKGERGLAWDSWPRNFLVLLGNSEWAWVSLKMTSTGEGFWCWKTQTHQCSQTSQKIKLMMVKTSFLFWTWKSPCAKMKCWFQRSREVINWASLDSYLASLPTFGQGLNINNIRNISLKFPLFSHLSDILFKYIWVDYAIFIQNLCIISMNIQCFYLLRNFCFEIIDILVFAFETRKPENHAQKREQLWLIAPHRHTQNRKVPPKMNFFG